MDLKETTLVELKAKVEGLEHLRRLLEGRAKRKAILKQRDVYFNTPRGRLKLRCVEGTKAQLVSYNRPDMADIKVSKVWLAEVEDGGSMEGLLSTALGVRVVVEKVREIWVWDGVQVHLDSVRGLGEFLEFELDVQDTPDAKAEGRRRLESMMAVVGVEKGALVAHSYSDLVERRN